MEKNEKLTIFEKIKASYKKGNLLRAFKTRKKIILQGAKYLLNDPGSKRIKLHCPEYVEPNKSKKELEIVKRIFNSYKKMKEDQKNVSKLYSPSPLWQSQLDRSYFYLNEALQTNNIGKFHFFLSNFGTWKTSTGIEWSTFMRENIAMPFGKKYLINDVFYNQLKIWKKFYNNRKSISQLSYPTYGNQAGSYIDGVFVGVQSSFNEIYGSTLAEIINSYKYPVVAELGAGYGKLAYFTLRAFEKFTYIDFDLPEVLCLAAYYLMLVWPDKKALLYGEEDYSQDMHKKYDLIFMPSYEIENIGESSANLFLNYASLGEMKRNAAENYLKYITDSTKYFFHMNHDVNPVVYPDNSKGLLGHEYPIPKDKFKLLFRYPDLYIMLHRGYLDDTLDTIFYLYERIEDTK